MKIADRAPTTLTRRARITGAMAIFLAHSLIGCVAGGQPRPARIAKPGQFSFDGYLPLATVGIGNASAVAPDPDTAGVTELDIDGPTFGLDEILGTGPPPFWWQLSGRVGIFPGCEVGVELGFFRLGGEVRCALLDQRKGMPVSVAAGAAAAYLPFYNRGGPWWRGALDISYRHAPQLTIMTNLYLSRGPEGRQLAGAIPLEFWDVPPDSTVSHSPSASAYIVRHETRLTTALGVALSGKGRYAAVLGIVPYFILDDPALSFSECRLCSAVTVTDFRERFGFSIVVGVTRLLP